jgi:hypothetical protein
MLRLNESPISQKVYSEMQDVSRTNFQAVVGWKVCLSFLFFMEFIFTSLINEICIDYKLAEVEQEFQRALQGYGNALGAENTTTYIPALNTIYALGSLFEY